MAKKLMEQLAKTSKEKAELESHFSANEVSRPDFTVALIANNYFFVPRIASN